MAVAKHKYADLSLTGANLKDKDSVLASIRNILYTRIGERPFKRDFGSRIQDLLFNPMTFANTRLILSEVKRSITKWEKRVEILPETNVTIDKDRRHYNLSLYLKIKGLDKVVVFEEQLIAK